LSVGTAAEGTSGANACARANLALFSIFLVLTNFSTSSTVHLLSEFSKYSLCSSGESLASSLAMVVLISNFLSFSKISGIRFKSLSRFVIWEFVTLRSLGI
jgi:hypothetical protein